jgi:hypothetical protein
VTQSSTVSLLNCHNVPWAPFHRYNAHSAFRLDMVSTDESVDEAGILVGNMGYKPGKGNNTEAAFAEDGTSFVTGIPYVHRVVGSTALAYVQACAEAAYVKGVYAEEAYAKGAYVRAYGVAYVHKGDSRDPAFLGT